MLLPLMSFQYLYIKHVNTAYYKVTVLMTVTYNYKLLTIVKQISFEMRNILATQKAFTLKISFP